MLRCLTTKGTSTRCLCHPRSSASFEMIRCPCLWEMNPSQLFKMLQSTSSFATSPATFLYYFCMCESAVKFIVLHFVAVGSKHAKDTSLFRFLVDVQANYFSEVFDDCVLAASIHTWDLCSVKRNKLPLSVLWHDPRTVWLTISVYRWYVLSVWTKQVYRAFVFVFNREL